MAFDPDSLLILADLIEENGLPDAGAWRKLLVEASAALVDGNAASNKCLAFQKELVSLFESVDGVKTFAERAIRKLGRDVHDVLVTPPSIEMQDVPWERRRLVRLVWSVNLSPEVPPELVANDLAQMVRDTVLKNWQSQSMLSGKKLPNVPAPTPHFSFPT